MRTTFLTSTAAAAIFLRQAPEGQSGAADGAAHTETETEQEAAAQQAGQAAADHIAAEQNATDAPPASMTTEDKAAATSGEQAPQPAAADAPKAAAQDEPMADLLAAVQGALDAVSAATDQINALGEQLAALAARVDGIQQDLNSIKTSDGLSAIVKGAVDSALQHVGSEFGALVEDVKVIKGKLKHF